VTAPGSIPDRQAQRRSDRPARDSGDLTAGDIIIILIVLFGAAFVGAGMRLLNF
jgi:hypothetical protein